MKRSASISFGTGPAPPRVQLVGFGIVALITGTIAVWAGIDSWELERTGIRTTGVVVATVPAENSFYPVFEFTDTQERRHTVRARVSGNDFPVGSTVQLIYPEDRPLRARIYDRPKLYFVTIVTGILSAAFLFGMFVIVRFRSVFQGIFAARVGKLTVTRKRTDGTATHREYRSSPFLTWVSRISTVVIVLMLIGVGWTAWHGYQLASTGVEAQGTVTALAPYSGSYRLQVEFSDVGGTIHNVVLPDQTADYLVGYPITVIYPPGNPSGARLPKWAAIYGWTIYFGLLNLVFLAVRTMTRIQLREIAKRNDRRGWE